MYQASISARAAASFFSASASAAAAASRSASAACFFAAIASFLSSAAASSCAVRSATVFSAASNFLRASADPFAAEAVRFAFSFSMPALALLNSSSSCFAVGALGRCPMWGVSNQAVAPALPATAKAFSVVSGPRVR